MVDSFGVLVMMVISYYMCYLRGCLFGDLSKAEPPKA